MKSSGPSIAAGLRPQFACQSKTGDTLKTCLVILLLLTFSLKAPAADLFESNETLAVTLSGPLNSLFHHKQDEQTYPFVLQAEGVDHQIMVRARGHSRKDLCVFPPLRIEFGANTAGDSVFFGQKDLKLVTHCNQSDKSQANTLKEFAAYQFFSLLTDAAYRVRLLQIDYLDTDGKLSAQKFGYVIEPTGALAKRIGGERARYPAVSLKSLDDQQEALVYVFQYMIGNTDWSMVSADDSDECCHNGKLIKKDQKLLYVPYDFDLSGLVNAHYAHPNASLSIQRVTQRLYRGFCMEPQVLRTAIQKVRSHEADFGKIVDSLPAISKSARKKMNRFLDRFFKEARKEDKMLKSFERRCLD
jgi:hypothetical protein